MAEWEELAENLKESNRHQAQHILSKLAATGYAVREMKNRAISPITFTSEEVEQMAEMEHARWMLERLLDGWKLGAKRDVSRKTSPYLVDWSKLPEEVKEWDRETVRKIPDFLAEAGFEIVQQ